MRVTLESDGYENNVLASVEYGPAATAAEVVQLFYQAMLGIGYERESVVDALESVADEHGIRADDDWE